MYPSISQMFSIDDDDNTLFLEFRIWVYSYFITENLMHWNARAGKVWDFVGVSVQ